MKYNTIIVPVMASFVALAAAAERNDQGQYRPILPPNIDVNSGTPNVNSYTPRQLRNGVGSVPVPVGNGPSFDDGDSSPNRTPQPVGDGQQLNRMPQPIGEGNQLNHMSDPVRDREITRTRRSRTHPTRDEHADVCGFLYVQASDNFFSGYVSVDRDDNGRYVVVSDQAQAVSTKIKAHNIVPSDGQGYEVMGATFGVAHDESTGDEHFGGNSGNFAMLTGTSRTLYGKGPSQGRSSFDDATGAHQRIESAVFTLGENGEIYPSWVDSDGVTTPGVWGVNDQRQVVYSANIDQYNAEFGGRAARVFCKTLVP